MACTELVERFFGGRRQQRFTKGMRTLDQNLIESIIKVKSNTVLTAVRPFADAKLDGQFRKPWRQNTVSPGRSEFMGQSAMIKVLCPFRVQFNFFNVRFHLNFVSLVGPV